MGADVIEWMKMLAAGHTPVQGHLLSVNVGAVRQVELAGRPRTTAIWKLPVSGRVAVRGVNLVGDEQADRRVHGGPDRAVYAYAREDYAWWERQLGRRLDPGTFGENLTTEGIQVTGALVGERWRVGSVVLQVTSPRVPCWKLGVRMGDPGFPRRFAAAGRPGAYLAIVEEGQIGAGDRIQVIHRPGHGVTVGLIAASYHRDHRLAVRILAAPDLPAAWRQWAEQQTRTRARRTVV
jgi:MOSC domain-containing protein YiiM